MPITENIQLPSYDELDVQDVNISQSVLVASGTYFGKYCDAQSKVGYVWLCLTLLLIFNLLGVHALQTGREGPKEMPKRRQSGHNVWTRVLSPGR